MKRALSACCISDELMSKQPAEQLALFFSFVIHNKTQ